MKSYELMYILDPSNEDGFEEVRQRLEEIIAGLQCEIVSFEKLGKKRLAYPIAKRQYGVYFLINFKGRGEVVQSIDYFLRLNPLAIRHIILAFSEKQIGLRELTVRIQSEEDERMRMGGKPFPVAKETEVKEAETKDAASEKTDVAEQIADEFAAEGEKAVEPAVETPAETVNDQIATDADEAHAKKASPLVGDSGSEEVKTGETGENEDMSKEVPAESAEQATNAPEEPAAVENDNVKSNEKTVD